MAVWQSIRTVYRPTGAAGFSPFRQRPRARTHARPHADPRHQPCSPAPLQRAGRARRHRLGLGSMLGAGVFVVFSPAAVRRRVAAVARRWPWPAPSPTATPSASAQLAASYPASGGAYVYGRRQLGEWPGFLAGWGFVTGKTASCAAMALTFGHYAGAGATPPRWRWPPSWCSPASTCWASPGPPG